MGTSKKVKKFFRNKTVWIILSVLVVLIVITTILIKTKAEPFVHKKIDQWLATSPFVKGSVTFEGPDINIVGRSIEVKNIQIKTDSLNTYSGKVRSIKISGISIRSLLFTDTLLIKEIKIVQPTIQVGENIPQNNPTKSTSKNPAPVISIKSFKIENGKLAISKKNMEMKANLSITCNDILINKNDSTNNTPVTLAKIILRAPEVQWKSNDMHVKGPVYIEGNQALIDPADTTGSMPLQMKSMQIKADSLVSMTADSTYRIVFKDVLFTKSHNDLNIGELRVQSPDDKLALGRRLGHEIDWMDLTGLKIHMEDFDYSRYLKTKELHIGHITLQDGDMTVFRDKRLSFPDKPNSVLPYVFLQRMGTPLFVDSLSVTNVNIRYEEFVAQGDKPGHVIFQDIEAGIGPFTNADSVSNHAIAQMKASCSIMGQARLQAYFSFPLNASSGMHYVNGHLNKMDMSAINPMITGVGFMRITEGKLESLDFKFAYNSVRSSGSLVMFYDKLKVETIDKQTNTSSGAGESIKSFLANSLIIQKNNTNDKTYREGQISFERDTKKSLFNYWWKSLLSGIKSTIMSTKESDHIKE